jgi:uncharacterized protein
MARPAPALPDAAALRARIDESGRLGVEVTAGAREEAVVFTVDTVLVKVRAPADRGAANAAVVQVVARSLGLAPSRVTLLRGGTSRSKRLQVSL